MESWLVGSSCSPTTTVSYDRKLAPERKAAMIADIPMGRAGTVDDVADVIAFLCHPESGYLTGVTYDINGGSHIS